jgi:hypothetical protein
VQAVDWKGLGLIDYTEIVKQPMDLGKVMVRLNPDILAFLIGILVIGF